MPFFQDFKAFLARGNVIDLAVGVIIGSAFGQIVSSLVKDIVMPPIGLLLGRVDFSDLYLNLSGRAYSSLSAAEKAGAPIVRYGMFFNTLVNFFIIALVIFLAVRLIHRLPHTIEKPSDQKKCPYCLSSIPVGATKCAHCTSELPSLSAEASEGADASH
ncbi:MAG: large conductance mechanosensitive channel protein MscL [Sporolactobacillus sp.]